MLRRLAGRPVTVRTLDFADDKLPPFLRPGAPGRLGRSLPLMLAEPDAFSAPAARHPHRRRGVDLRIMIPMVATVAELRAAGIWSMQAAADWAPPRRRSAR